MAEVGSAFVSIVPSAKGFGKNLERQVGSETDAAGKNGGKRFGTAFKLGAVAVLGGAALLGKFLKGSLEEAREAQKVGAQTNAVIKSTGSAANVTASQVGKLASAISRKTGIDDEAIQSGQNLLLTFKGIRNEAGAGNDIFNQTSKVLVDMAAAMGTEPKAAAIQLGKALNDPIKGVSALARVGVTFTDQQKKTIKSLVEGGKTAQAQKIILKELNSEFGGSAEASATAGDKFKVAFGNLQETVGTLLLPIVDRLATSLTGVALALGNNVGPAFSKASAFIAPFVAQARAGFAVLTSTLAGIGPSLKSGASGGVSALKPLLGAIASFASNAVTAGTKIAPALRTIAKGLLPLAKGAAAAGIQALTVAFRALGPALVKAATALANVVSFVSSNMTTFKVLAGIIGTLLIPAFIAWGVQATVAAAKNVLAWTTSKLAAVGSVAAQIASLTLIAAGWVASAAAAVASGATTVAIWLLIKADAIASVAAQVVAFATMAAGWIATGVAATAGALVVAAAWLIALGPIGLLIAAVIAVVALIILKWDTVKAATVAVWKAVSGAISSAVSFVINFVKAKWPLLVAIITGPLGLIVLVVVKNWDKIKSAFQAGITGAVTLAKSLPTRLLTIFIGLAEKLYNAGKQLMSRLAAGIGEGVDKVLDPVKDVASKIGGLFPGSPVKTGPLTSFNKGATGVKLMEMLASGIVAGSPKAVSAAIGAATAIQKGVLDRLNALRDKTKSIIADLRGQFASMRDSIASSFSGDLFSATSLTDFLQGGKNQSFLLTQLTKAVEKLKGFGVAPGFISQLFASGNTDLIFSLANGSQGQVLQAEHLFNLVGNQAQGLGQSVASNQFGPELRKQTSLLARIDQGIEDLPAKFGQVINKAGNSAHSASGSKAPTR